MEGTTAAVSVQAALKLSALWKLKQHAKILQAAPPPHPANSSKLYMLLQQSMQLILQIQAAEKQATEAVEASGDSALLKSLMQIQPITMLAKIACWIQLRPQLIDFAAIATSDDHAGLDTADVSYSKLWLVSMEALSYLLHAAAVCLPDGSGADWCSTEQVRMELDVTGLLGTLPALLDRCLRQLLAAKIHVGCSIVNLLMKLISVPYCSPLPGFPTRQYVSNMQHVLQYVQKVAVLLKLPDHNNSSSSTDSTNSSTRASLTGADSNCKQASPWATLAVAQRAVLARLAEVEVYTPFAQLNPLLRHMTGVLDQIKEHDTTALTILQTHTVYCQMLHATHSNESQDMQQQQQPESSMPVFGSRYLQECASANKRPIRAAHMQCKQLVPSAGYVTAMQEITSADVADHSSFMAALLGSLQHYAEVLSQRGSDTISKLSSSLPLLQPVAVHLMLDTLLLMAATEHDLQHHSQQQQQQTQEQNSVLCGTLSVVQLVQQRCLAILRQQLYLLAEMQQSAGCSKERRAVLESCGPQLLKVLTYLLMNTSLEAERADGTDTASHEAEATRSAARRHQPAAVTQESQQGPCRGNVFDGWARASKNELLSLLCAVHGVTLPEQEQQHPVGSAETAQQPSAMEALATAHPVQFFSMIEVCFRAQLEPAHAVVPLKLLASSIGETQQHMLRVLRSPKATAAACSAIATAVKYWVLAIEAARQKQQRHIAKSQKVTNARLHFDTVGPHVMIEQLIGYLIQPLVASIYTVITKENILERTDNDSRSSNITNSGAACLPGSLKEQQQIAASSMFLLVVLARSVWLLYQGWPDSQAVPGSGPDSQAGSVSGHAAPGRNGFNDQAVPGLGKSSDSDSVILISPSSRLAVGFIYNIERVRSVMPYDMAAIASVVSKLWWTSILIWPQQAICTRKGWEKVLPDNMLVNDSEGRSLQRGVQWSYMLQLGDSQKLKSASKTFFSKWVYEDIQSLFHELADAATAAQQAATKLDVAGETKERAMSVAADAMQLMHKLVAAVPLPVVCNNPHCTCMHGCTEATTAVRECSGCGARYCGVECQQQDWLRHKKACRRMAAAGWSVNACS